ncbi:MFS general substrate transporter [Yamadazyma tenuis ATCC 10573]|nr:MFS general substrate transporter [Yamadazyma tenuis ATCC 10573]EGV63595.1 MFS general substrate transporter [Yamadazyma tenuis ATCC 10573]
MDFFCVSATAPNIALTLNVSITQVTWGITLVLMFRSLGATIFGLASDYYGRKYTYILVCLLFVVIEIGTGFVKTYGQFLGVRALFGIAMGGFYPICATTALEDQPTKARGILSGLFLPGYNLGYIFAMAFFLAFEHTFKEGEGWRSLFWFSAGLPCILITWRFFLPETQTFIKLQEQKKILKEHDERAKVGIYKYLDKTIVTTIKTEWVLFIYLVLLMAGFNFTSHGSQDLFNTLLQKQLNIDSKTRVTIICVSNLGAIVGGLFFGQLNELLGRRLTIIICQIMAGAFLYPSFFSDHVPGIIGGYFFLNFAVMGAWGVVPIHLLELVNTNHRSFLSGVVYQLGNLASSASSTIEAQIGTQFPIGDKTGSYDYGLVMAIFCGAVFGYMIIIIILGPERYHRDLGIESDTNSIQRADDSEGASTVESKEVPEHVEQKV